MLLSGLQKQMLFMRCVFESRLDKLDLYPFPGLKVINIRGSSLLALDLIIIGNFVAKLDEKNRLLEMALRDYPLDRTGLLGLIPCIPLIRYVLFGLPFCSVSGNSYFLMYLYRVVQLDLTPEIEKFCMLFDRYLSNFTVASPKQNLECFLRRIQLIRPENVVKGCVSPWFNHATFYHDFWRALGGNSIG